MKIKLIKFKEDLILPIRAHYNDAGIDCYAQEDFVLEGAINNKITGKLISLGFGLNIPDGYMAVLKPRSSMNIKGIISQIGTIDSGYKGEIKAYFINTSDKSYEFKKGDKICQIVIEPVILADLVEELGEERGVGGFGSTGN